MVWGQGPLEKPACSSCKGVFYQMDGYPVAVQGFGSWAAPEIVEAGVGAHQLYSQITWRFYDIFFGIVMVFDAENGNKGPDAGHVHCMLSWSPDGKHWKWVDSAGLAGLKEFIPKGKLGSFESHVCFAAHSPLKMPDGSTRLYYMGGNGPHSGARNSSFGLATLPADRFAGISSGAAGGSGGGSTISRAVNITGTTMIITLDVLGAGGVTVGIVGQGTPFQQSARVTGTGTDVTVAFPGASAGLTPLVGKEVQLKLTVANAAVYTIGFK